VSDQIQLRVIDYWSKVDAELGARVAAGLGKTNGRANGAAARTDAALSQGGAR
jgi:hypothetical protein